MFAPVTAPLDTLLGRQEFRCAVQIQSVFTRINNEYTLQLCPLEHMLSLLLIRNNYLCRKYSPKRRAIETTAQKLKPNANEMKCGTYKTKHTSDRWMLPREWQRAGERESSSASAEFETVRGRARARYTKDFGYCLRTEIVQSCSARESDRLLSASTFGSCGWRAEMSS